ncbi:MAG: DegT/DnrJ/EryC1/StrS family aminotransferase, partial [Ferruginibacter sp.]
LYKGKSLLSYGDIITCSFHATKLFHTVEGGCIIANNDAVAHQPMLYRQFGHVYDDYFTVGVNGKNSELHAAMGLAVLPEIENIIADRKKTSAQSDSALAGFVQRPLMHESLVYNYAYYPVVFRSEEQLLEVVNGLKQNDISGRRYFYPSLNELPFLSYQSCQVSEDVSRRVLCLPLYFGLTNEEVKLILDCILKTF